MYLWQSVHKGWIGHLPHSLTPLWPVVNYRTQQHSNWYAKANNEMLLAPETVWSRFQVYVSVSLLRPTVMKHCFCAKQIPPLTNGRAQSEKKNESASHQEQHLKKWFSTLNGCHFRAVLFPESFSHTYRHVIDWNRVLTISGDSPDQAFNLTFLL